MSTLLLLLLLLNSFSRVQLFVTPRTIQSMEFSRILERVAVPFSRGSYQPRYRTRVSCIDSRSFSTSTTWVLAAFAAKSLQSCQTLCDPRDGSPPGSPVPGILQTKHWSGLPFPSPMQKVKNESEVTQSCLTLPDPMDCSLPDSSTHEIFQARVLEWGAITFSA